MPKMKTHKASRKRFRVSANGKLKRSQAGKKHLNSPKSSKCNRHLRGRVAETGVVAQSTSPPWAIDLTRRVPPRAGLDRCPHSRRTQGFHAPGRR